MSILVVGSVAFDSISTPHGTVDRCLGGAATHFALAASFFTQVRVIGVVGEDFTSEQEAVFQARGIDIQGIERTAGKCFHWTGEYLENLNEAHTLRTDLNVFERFQPKIPEAYRDSEFLFLANIDPVLQQQVRKQMPKVRMVCGDTMNYWITGHRENLLGVLQGLDALLINDGEAKLLAGETNLVQAAKRIMEMGPKTLIVKQGEYGATAFFGDNSFSMHVKNRFFHAPALPLAEVVDPTGAGDSFAGGFFGYLASQPQVTPSVFKRAMFYGGVMGSFAVERFGTERIRQLTREEIDQRFAAFRELSHLDAE
ncbi:MAG TPA: PfkB family carbohydrate kinase [Acidobacteriaceae bacterium]|nr:PfkB family carbohydrate kinase [Acidobacteriaceae bacterium]